jgi:hypothetical protein
MTEKLTVDLNKAETASSEDVVRVALDSQLWSFGSWHLFRYLDEQAFRFNEREGEDSDRFEKALGSVAGRRLTYRQLTGISRRCILPLSCGKDYYYGCNTRGCGGLRECVPRRQVEHTGCVSEINPGGFPAVVAQMHLVVSFEAGAAEFGTENTFGLHFWRLTAAKLCRWMVPCRSTIRHVPEAGHT